MVELVGRVSVIKGAYPSVWQIQFWNRDLPPQSSRLLCLLNLFLCEMYWSVLWSTLPFLCGTIDYLLWLVLLLWHWGQLGYGQAGWGLNINTNIFRSTFVGKYKYIKIDIFGRYEYKYIFKRLQIYSGLTKMSKYEYKYNFSDWYL